MILISFFSSYHTLVETRKKSMYVVAKDKIKMCINILRIAKRVPVEHPQFAGENN